MIHLLSIYRVPADTSRLFDGDVEYLVAMDLVLDKVIATNARWKREADAS